MTQQLTTKDFVENARMIHGCVYDYSSSVYITSITKLEIICEEHGSFWQTPNNHISGGTGCPSCGKHHNGITALSNNDQFIYKANHIHDGKYSYNKAIYINSRTKLAIHCPEHGEFWQTPNSHLYNANGCLKCWQDIRGKKYD